jgi:hypothetical protein
MKRGSGKQWVEGKGFRLADEVRYILVSGVGVVSSEPLISS